MPEVITIGETMVLFSPMQNGPLRYVHGFQKSMAGAESNVAIGLTKLSHSCGWLRRGGPDEFGEFLLREIRGEGVDVAQVKMDPEAPTGLMFKEIHEGRETKVYYYRRNSAASRMSPDDLDEEYISRAKILHLTGITPALSQSCRETVYRAIEMAREKGILVSFDPNIRLKLWNRKEAAEVLGQILRRADIVLPGLDEAQMILGLDEPDEIIDALLSFGIKKVALKLGKEGALVADRESRIKVDGFKVDRVVDPIGAGDAYAAGFLAGILEGKSLLECGRLANAMGAFAVTSRGDIEGLPTRSELEAFIEGHRQVAR